MRRPMTRALTTALVVATLLSAACAREPELGRSSRPSDRDRSVAAAEALAARFRASYPAKGGAAISVDELEAHVSAHPVIFGAAVAIARPGTDGRVVEDCPYVDRQPDGSLRVVNLATPTYDVERQPWYRRPVEEQRPIWTKPYLYTDGDREIDMVTYSIPISVDGEIVAVVTSDLLHR